MKYCFMAALYHLRVRESLQHGDQIIPRLYISNDREKAKKLITKTFVQSAGMIEVEALVNSKAFVYSVHDAKPKVLSKAEQITLLNEHLTIVQLFLNMLWLVKDCSINMDLGFIQCGLGNPVVDVSSNYLSTLFSKADGSFATTEFSREELRIARTIFRDYHKPAAIDPLNMARFIEPYGDVTRIERCFFLLQAARSSSFIPLKIALYCTCFESLVSTDTSELSHRVAERTAALLRDKGNDPIEVYASLRKAYKVRSEVVHGDKIRTSKKECINLSVVCDSLLRTLLNTIMTDKALWETIDKSKPEELNSFFLRKLLKNK